MREHLQPFALAKISIALALKDGFCSKENTDDDGLTKALIELNEQRHIYEEEYFPNVVKQYIDYGAVLLRQEYRYGHDFYAHLVSLEKGI